VGDRIPASGPGRLDTINPAKAVEVGWSLEDRVAQHGIADLVATMDFSPTWNLAKRDGMRLHWDGNLGDVHEAILSAILAVGGKPQTVDNARLARVERFIRELPSPKYPFAVDEALSRRGKAVFDAGCAQCHAGSRTGQVIPIEVVGTDPHRLKAFTAEFASRLPAALNRNYARSEYRFDTFAKTDGYVAVPLDGIWARAPFLHNGSVPTLRDLLEPAACRPRFFARGNDVYDPVNVGFQSWAAQAEPPCAPRGAPDGPAPRTAPNGARLFHFDTTLPGNDNGGHLFGTDLTPADKTALLEYLKTL
jgi:hypothetical protein